MVHEKSAAVSGRDHYAQIYGSHLETEAEWLRMGAREKADSVEILLARHGIRPASLLELGAGTGAVIQECQRRGIAREYAAIDYSSDATEYLRAHSSGIDVVQADITDPALAAPAKEYDVVVASHVVEHLEEPERFLAGLRRISFGHAVIEVPLENLAAGRIKARLWDRTGNRAGHVQFFDVPAFEALLRRGGLEVVDRRVYAPVQRLENIRFVTRKNRRGTAGLIKAALTGRYLPMLLGPAWRRLYYAHCAVLARPL
jgi:predicted TPR repeat methyltransferase